MRLTNHGRNRARQRAGLPRNKVCKEARAAHDTGLKPFQLSAPLAAWVNSKHLVGRAARVYKGRLWIFRGGNLITVMNVPQELVPEIATSEAWSEAVRREKQSRADRADVVE